MKKFVKYAIWCIGGFIVVLFLLIAITNTLPYFTEPRKIDPEDCDAVAQDRAEKAIMIQEKYPESVEKESDFRSFYNAFYDICIKSGI